MPNIAKKETLSENPLILFQDGARFGRIGDVRRYWSPRVMRPVFAKVNSFVNISVCIQRVPQHKGEMFIQIL